MKLSSLIEKIDYFDTAQFGKHVQARLDKIIPCVKTMCLLSRMGEPEFITEEKFIGIRWRSNINSLKELKDLRLAVKMGRSALFNKGNKYVVMVPTGRINEDVFNSLGISGNGDYVVKNLLAKSDFGSKKGREITHFKTEVTLKVEISTRATGHSNDRQDDRNISDSDIRATVVKGTEKVLQLFLDGKIKENEKFHIYDPGNKDLNLIATFDMNTKGTPEKITIVTAMRSKNFHANNVKRTIKV